MCEFTVPGDGRRADLLLSEATGLTRSRVAALMEQGYCDLDGIPCLKAGTKAATGKSLKLIVPDPKPAVPQPEDLPLDIL